MEDTATPQPSDTNNPDDHQPARSGAEEHSPGRSLSTYARPALIAGVVIAVVCIALLIVIFALDTFDAAAYSVSGKDISDATDEARDIRDLYSGARAGGIIGLVISGVVAIGAGVVLYLNRGTAGGSDEEDYDLEDLRDQ
jgi:hypothetical protein